MENNTNWQGYKQAVFLNDQATQAHIRQVAMHTSSNREEIHKAMQESAFWLDYLAFRHNITK